MLRKELALSMAMAGADAWVFQLGTLEDVALYIGLWVYTRPKPSRCPCRNVLPRGSGLWILRLRDGYTPELKGGGKEMTKGEKWLKIIHKGFRHVYVWNTRQRQSFFWTSKDSLWVCICKRREIWPHIMCILMFTVSVRGHLENTCRRDGSVKCAHHGHTF
jgi:hypothetical protein